MTNPGYVCTRKRKRDIFVMKNLFGGIGFPMNDMTGVGLLTGEPGNINAPLLAQQDQVFLSGNPIEKPFPSADNSTLNLTNSSHQNDQIATNGINPASIGIPPNFTQNGDSQTSGNPATVDPKKMILQREE